VLPSKIQKIVRGRRPTSTVRGKMQEESRDFSNFRDSPFLYPVFAIITGFLKHLFIETPSIKRPGVTKRNSFRGNKRGGIWLDFRPPPPPSSSLTAVWHYLLLPGFLAHTTHKRTTKKKAVLPADIDGSKNPHPGHAGVFIGVFPKPFHTKSRAGRRRKATASRKPPQS
jgi:hypothetical protein